jgi:lysophospholipase L1-like esterase
MPRVALYTLGIFCLGMSAIEFAPELQQAKFLKWLRVSGWLLTVAVAATWVLGKWSPFTLDSYQGVLASAVAGIILLGCRGETSPQEQKRWRILGSVWSMVGIWLWLIFSYEANEPWLFHLSLALLLMLLIFCKRWLAFPGPIIVAVNTAVVFLIGLPIADLFYRPSNRLNTAPEVAKMFYSYDEAQKNPTAFARWWNFYLEQWHAMGKQVFVPDPTGEYPFKLRPNGRGKLFNSLISINSKGFRGPEFAMRKEAHYRILCLGESTTFGCTLGADDKPWPELLEEKIRERLPLLQGVEVINAGIPSYDLTHNISRLREGLTALKPDMIISYHGYNGFAMLYGALPPPYGGAPPEYRLRPLKLFADCEYRWKMFQFRKKNAPRLPPAPLPIPNPMETAYARAYEDLVKIAQTNGIRLLLANFSMAVNQQSGLELVEFYRKPFPAVHWQIEANAVLSRIVETITHEHPETYLVDTHPKLDGQHEKFIDLVHFTQAGREQLAETFFLAVKKVLDNPQTHKRAAESR